MGLELVLIVSVVIIATLVFKTYLDSETKSRLEEQLGNLKILISHYQNDIKYYEDELRKVAGLQNVAKKAQDAKQAALQAAESLKQDAVTWVENTETKVENVAHDIENDINNDITTDIKKVVETS